MQPRPPGALLTDLYQLTMLQTYLEHGMTGTAIFELFIRRLPPGRSFFLTAGLEQALDYLQDLRFEAAELDGLTRGGYLTPATVDRLAGLRFTGEVHAMPEGTVAFPLEPILRVTAPLPQAQVVESRLINLIHFQTLIASKAARCTLAAPDRTLVDFGMRRAHGAEAAVLAARAAYIAGFAGTATVSAGLDFGIPLFGTMAHSLIQAHDREELAFEHFAHSHPDNIVLLLDTYDTETAAHRVVELAPSLRARGLTIRGVRIDSGDLGEQARRVRLILDRGGLDGITILISGDLDEYRIRQLLADGAPIDGFGVGTRLTLSADQPSLDCVYKLQEYDGRPRRKRSRGKATWPGCKQVYRQHHPDGTLAEDRIDLWDSSQPGRPLLVPVMAEGRRLQSAESLQAIRERASEQLAALPRSLTDLDDPAPPPVSIMPALKALADQLDREQQ